MTASPEGRYRPGTSRLHRLDPRVKVVSTVLLILGILLTPEHALPAYPLLWALLGSLAEIGGLGALRVAKRASLALPFALAALTLAFTTPGQPLFTVLGLPVSDAGLLRFFIVSLKSWLAVQVTLLLTMSTAFTDLLWALSSLRLPRTLVMLIGLTYRYLFTLKEEAESLNRARLARSGAMAGAKPGGRLLWRAQVAGGMIGSLFVRSYERSERVYLAMRARGYNGQMRTLQAQPVTWGAVMQGALPVLILFAIEVLAFAVWGG